MSIVAALAVLSCMVVGTLPIEAQDPPSIQNNLRAYSTDNLITKERRRVDTAIKPG